MFCIEYELKNFKSKLYKPILKLLINAFETYKQTLIISSNFNNKPVLTSSHPYLSGLSVRLPPNHARNIINYIQTSIPNAFEAKVNGCYLEIKYSPESQ